MKKKKILSFELVIALIVIIAATPIFLNVAEFLGKQDEGKGSRVLEISMSGYTPATIKAKAGEEITVKLINPDNSAHTDGGGWHQFASDELDIDYRLAPESTQTITLKVDQPGEYEFYCDICCGGLENPSMQGKLIIS